MTDSDDKNTKSAALASLLVAQSQLNSESPESKDGAASDTLQAIGPVPTEEEIWNWIHKDVSQPRAQEIRSHLAVDTRLYEIWRQQRLALAELNSEKVASEQSLSSNVRAPSVSQANVYDHTQHDKDALKSEKKPKQIRKYLTTGAGLAIAASLALFLALGPMLQQTNQTDFWLDWSTPKSSVVRELSEDQQASLKRLQGAMRTELQKNNLATVGPAGEELPAPDCAGNESCSRNEETLASLGATLVQTRLHCIKKVEIPQAVFESVSAASAAPLPELALLQQPLLQLTTLVTATQSESNQQLICDTTDAVIQRALIAK